MKIVVKEFTTVEVYDGLMVSFIRNLKSILSVLVLRDKRPPVRFQKKKNFLITMVPLPQLMTFYLNSSRINQIFIRKELIFT